MTILGTSPRAAHHGELPITLNAPMQAPAEGGTQHVRLKDVRNGACGKAGMMSVIDFPTTGIRDVVSESAVWQVESAAWLRVTADVTIAHAGQMFGGMVVRQWGRYTAFDLFGAPCGVFSSMDDAEHGVEAVLAHPSVASWLRDATRPVGDREISTARTRGLVHIGTGTTAPGA